MEEEQDYKDKSYAKKNKNLCKYCSYKNAVPSKMNLFCSEICRLLYIAMNNELNIEDISKLIKLSKVELIQIILSLKSQNFTKNSLSEVCEKKIKKSDITMKVNKGNFNLDFT
mgnify:CR=1 FL=1|tara:strand:+ start:123 stop:461 length:339 start_codon:yes stop_codon:yes gene_type:complete